MTSSAFMPTLRWPVADFEQTIQDHISDCRVQVLAQIDSTNSELMRRARDGDHQPTLLIAERQTAGRGRLGRSWQSGQGQAGDTLACSLGLNLTPRNWSGLSLAVGLALAQALHPEIRLKWPNDLWWQDKKLGGILIETVGNENSSNELRARYTVIGFGINIAPLPPANFDTPPTCLQALFPNIEAPTVLAQALAPLALALRQFVLHGFAPLVESFHQRDALAGQAVVLSDGVQGTAAGVTPDGALLVRTEAGIRVITSAALSVRPYRQESLA